MFDFNQFKYVFAYDYTTFKNDIFLFPQSMLVNNYFTRNKNYYTNIILSLLQNIQF